MNVIEEEDPHVADDESSALDSETNGRGLDPPVIDEDQRELKRNAVRTGIVAVIVILLGAATSVSFLYLGISNARDDEQDSFERRASDLSKEIGSTLRDYEMAAAWIHETCRNWREGNFTRKDFHVLYNYLEKSSRLEFYVAEWVPNISHAERPALEQEMAAYWANDPLVDYQGFVGAEPNKTDPNKTIIDSRSEQPFYFPIQFLEPVENMGTGTHLDLYSLPYERVAIDRALTEFVPVLTERFKIVSREPEGWSVSLMHPGVALPNELFSKPRDLALMFIEIKNLLERAARSQRVGFAIYLFDATQTLVDGSEEAFLGGIDIEVMGTDAQNVTAENRLTYHEDNVTMGDVEDRSNLLYVDSITFGTRTWSIAVVPIDDSEYSPDLTFPILAGVMIFAASVLLVWIWVINNRNRSRQVHKIMNEAAAESAIVSSLYPAGVRERLIQLMSRGTSAGIRDTNASNKHDAFKNDGNETRTFMDHSSGLGGTGGVCRSDPIAELYPATTVMYVSTQSIDLSLSHCIFSTHSLVFGLCTLQVC